MDPVLGLIVTVGGFAQPQALPTTTLAVSVHPEALVQTYLYVPTTLKLVIVVVGEVAVVIAAVPGLEANADQVPVPVAAMVATSVVKQTTV
jgi:hypothetical protein